MLLVAETEGADEAPSQDELLIFAHEQRIERVEIRLEPSEGRRIGFALRDLDEPSADHDD